MEEKAASNICNSAAVHGVKYDGEEPVNGASGAGYGEFKEVSLAEILVFIMVIFVAKKSEVLQNFQFYSSVLVSSRSAEWRSSLEIFYLFVA